MSSTKKAAPAILALLALAAACSDGGSSPSEAEIAGPSMDTYCTMELRYAVAAEVPTTTPGFDPARAWLIVRDGAYADSSTFYYMVGRGSTTYYGAAAAEERAGTYEVTVRAPGFQDWTQTGVKVTADRCHVRDVILYPELVPAN